MDREPDYIIQDYPRSDRKTCFWWPEMKRTAVHLGGYETCKPISVKDGLVGIQSSTEFIPYHEDVQVAYQQYLARVIVGESHIHPVDIRPS